MMTELIRVKVTQEDIDQGGRCDGEDCPVARALVREGCSDVWVSDEEIYFTRDGVKYAALPTITVTEFVLRFDSRQPVSPCSLIIVGELDESDGRDE